MKNQMTKQMTKQTNPGAENSSRHCARFQIRTLAAFLAMILLLVTACPAVPFAAPASQVIEIGTAEDLLALAEHCVLDTWSQGKTVRLTADIDLAGEDFYGIPLFAGNFEGGGHTISGLSISDETVIGGLFRRVLAGAAVSDLKVTGSVMPDQDQAAVGAEVIGGIAGENFGNITNCSVNLTVKADRIVGGIAGRNGESGVIERCIVRGSVTGNHRIGGLAGENSGVIRDCTSYAAVNTEMPEETGPAGFDLSTNIEEIIDITDIGGIAGLSSGVIEFCRNEGDVGYPRVGYNIGGIAGHLSGRTRGCRNSGSINGRKDVGGIAGQLDPDARWHSLPGKLGELQSRLDELHAAINTLVGDAEAEKSRLTGSIAQMLAAVERTGDAAENLSGEVTDFLNDNIDAINDLSERVSEVLTGIAPAAGELGNAAASLESAGRRAAEALRILREGVLTEDPEAALLVERIAALAEEIEGIRTDLAGLADEAGALSSVRDGEALSAAIGAIREKLSALESRVSSLREAVRSVREEALALIERAGEGSSLAQAEGAIAQAAEELETAGTEIAEAFSSLKGAGDRIRSAVEKLTEKGAISFTGADPDHSAGKELFASLAQIRESLDAMNTEAESTALLRDLAAVSDRLFSVMDFLIGSLSGDEETERREYIEDISDAPDNREDVEAANHEGSGAGSENIDRDEMPDGIAGGDVGSAGQNSNRNGLIASCENLGSVCADTNVGGVVGAVSIDLSFDREDELDLSAILSDGARYLIYAVVRDCVNTAEITARKETAGGIAGRMDYGAVIASQAAGTVISEGSYAGGIAGRSKGTIRDSLARCEVRTSRFSGGIAGEGRDLYRCLAMPVFADRAPYQGAIAGDAQGVLRDNYYARCAVGAVNGFSFEGQGQDISYEELCEKAGESDLFSVVEVTFLGPDDRILDVITVPFGGRIEKLPTLPELDGSTWRWDEFDNRALLRSITVGGSYVSPITVLATEEELPNYLVEGIFYEGQQLQVTAETVDVTAFGFAQEDLVAAASLYVEGFEGSLHARMRTTEDGSIYVLKEGQNAEKLDSRRDGSYVIFDLANGETFFFLKEKQSGVPLFPIVVGAVAVLVLAAVLIRKKGKNGETPDIDR